MPKRRLEDKFNIWGFLLLLFCICLFIMNIGKISNYIVENLVWQYTYLGGQ